MPQSRNRVAVSTRYWCHVVVGIAIATATARAQPAPPPSNSPTERVARVLARSPLVDGHNDFLSAAWRRSWTADSFDFSRPMPAFMTDVPRLRAGKVGAQFWVVYVPAEPEYPRPYQTAAAQLDLFRGMLRRNPDLEQARTAADIVRITKSGKIASILALESGHIIENSLDNLRALYQAGVRYMTLTHWRATEWADAATDSARHGGLTARGRAIVREMNRLGMMVDLSHVSDRTMRDALAATRAPVIFSHSSIRRFSDHVRNVPDDVLRLLPANGGIVMINFDAWFVHQPTKDWYARRDRIATNFSPVRRMMGDTAMATDSIKAWEAANPVPLPTIANLADHFDHVRRLIGSEYVGIGSDYDGTDYNPIGMDDVSRFPALLEELARRGWSDTELGNVAGGNLLRVMRRVEAVAARARRGATGATGLPAPR